jgi:hypothetical protein
MTIKKIPQMSNRNQIATPTMFCTEIALTYKHLSPYNWLSKKGLLIKSGHKLKFLSVLVGVKSHHHYIVTRTRQHTGE